MIDQINLFTGGASIRYSIILNIILLAAIVILSLVFYLIARKRKHERLVKKKQLDTQQKFARELLDSVPAGFILLTPNGNIKQVNRQASTNLNCEQLLALISDILDLSKIESNTMVFNITEQPLTPLLQNILRAQQINVPQEVELLLDLPATDTIITTDPLRLKQVINNLINNAIKFTSKGAITLGYRQNNDQVSIFVKDTGTGIDEDKINRIFERFYKGDNFVQGTGLGLAISHTIVEHLKGTITVTSEIGKGSHFTIQHPIKRMGY